jgi:hypothetical protein
MWPVSSVKYTPVLLVLVAGISGCDGVRSSGIVHDDCGVCGGDDSSCAGCDSIPNSGVVLDACGVCGGDHSSCAGCDGIANSGVEYDICGVCGGDGSICGIFQTFLRLLRKV